MTGDQEKYRIRTGGSENRPFFYITSDEGFLTSTLDRLTGDYEVIDYVIHRPLRGQGHGKEYIRFALEHARSLGARALIGTNIVSRESLDVARSVLGEDAVDVVNMGDYTPQGKDDNIVNPTKATARYPL